MKKIETNTKFKVFIGILALVILVFGWFILRWTVKKPGETLTGPSVNYHFFNIKSDPSVADCPFLSIKTDKQTHEVGENISITYIIKNLCREDFSIPVTPEKYFFSLKLVNSKGKVITKIDDFSDFFTPLFYDSVILSEIPLDSFIILKGESIYEGKASLSSWLPAEYDLHEYWLPDGKLKLPKDEYNVTLEYHSIARLEKEKDIVKDVSGVKRWLGTLTSDTIKIEIK